MSIEKASRNGNPVAASGRSLSGFAKEAVSILSGYRMLASVPRSLRSTFTDMLGTARNILTSQPPVDTAPPEITDAGDRFEWLREYNGVSEEEILSRRRTTRVWFTAWAFASVFMIAFAIAAPMAGLIGHSFLRPLDYTLPWSVAAVMVAKAMQWSLWNMQLRYRALLSFADWARSGEWLDPLSDKAKSVLGIVLAVGATSVIAHPATAAADVMNIQTLISTITADPTSATDLGMQMLARVFPSVFAISGVSYQQDAIAQIWATLNTLIMSVSTGMLTYHTLHAMVDVAHEGSVMGQGRWHATWAPLRVCVGVGSIVPLNGYCIAQLVMLRCVMAGFLLANVAWTQIVSITMGVGSNTASITIPPNPGQQMATFQAIIASEACYWALTYDNSPLIPASTPGAGIASPSGPGYSTGRKAVNYPDPNGTTQTLSDGNKAVVWDYGAVCGRITWPIRTAAAAQTQFGAASLINAIMPRTFDSCSATIWMRMSDNLDENRQSQRTYGVPSDCRLQEQSFG